jgi:hypothetical protein
MYQLKVIAFVPLVVGRRRRPASLGGPSMREDRYRLAVTDGL